MKKLFGLFLLAGVFAFATACGGNDAATTEEGTTEEVKPDANSSEEATTPEVPADSAATNGEAGVQ